MRRSFRVLWLYVRWISNNIVKRQIGSKHIPWINSHCARLWDRLCLCIIPFGKTHRRLLILIQEKGDALCFIYVHMHILLYTTESLPSTGSCSVEFRNALAEPQKYKRRRLIGRAEVPKAESAKPLDFFIFIFVSRVICFCLVCQCNLFPLSLVSSVTHTHWLGFGFGDNNDYKRLSRCLFVCRVAPR